jgi:hypothetical protein
MIPFVCMCVITYKFFKKITLHHALYFPEKCVTIRDLVFYIVQENTHVDIDKRNFNKEELWIVLCRFASDYSGLDAGEIRKEDKLADIFY